MESLVHQEAESVVSEAYGLDGLTRLLRERRDVDQLDCDDLAVRCGLPVAFVQDVVAELHNPAPRRTLLQEFAVVAKETTQYIGRKIKRFYHELTSQTNACLWVSGAAILALIYAAAIFPNIFARTLSPTSAALNEWTLAGMGSLLIFQQIFFFRHGEVKLPIFVSATLFIGLQPLAILSTIQAAGVVRQNPFVVYLLINAALLAILMAVAGLGVLSALAGGFLNLKHGERSDRRMTRQEMLARVFDIQEKLSIWDRQRGKLVRKKSIIDRARQSAAFPLLGSVFGGIFGLVEVGLLGSLTAARPDLTIEPATLLSGLVALSTLVAFILAPLLAFLTGGIKRASIAILSAYGARLGTWLIPLGVFGPDYIRNFLIDGQQYSQLVLCLVIALVCGAMGSIDEKTSRRNRRKDDPASLVAELLSLQWRLNPGRISTTVMVVDVARSTRIKSEADPLDIEWSFREYQRMVADSVEANAGEVVSTAGDGAVAVFNDPKKALVAARTIQTQINDFNSNINRLNHPFRLRIGLHSGETQADLNLAPFNELIDVAAHIEQAAPVGGIAVSSRVRDELTEEKLADVTQDVDGFRVSIVLNPVLAP